MGSSRNTIGVVILAGGVLAGASAVLAQGDGSRTDNPDLLRGSLGVGCSPGTLCHFPRQELITPVDLPPSAVSYAPPVAPSVPTPAPAPVQPLPAYSAVPAPAPNSVGDLSYGVSLRGAYVRSNGDERFEILAIPHVSLSRSGASTDTAIGASASIVRPQSDDPRLASGDVSAIVTHRLSPSAGLAFDASLALAQDDPRGLSVRDTDVQDAPLEIAGGLGAAYSQRLGQFNTIGTLGVSRDWRGPTTLIDGSEIDNTGDNSTAYQGGLRVGYAVSPVVEVFGSGNVGRAVFDAADPDLGASRTSTDFALRGGIAGNWQEVLTLEASLGSGWRRYDEAAISDAQTWLYGAALGYRLSDTTQLTAALETELSPGEGSSGASTDYRLRLGANHIANSWLGLRARAGLDWRAPEDGAPATRFYTAGVGADFTVGPHTTATLDYDYGLREDPGADEPRRDEHRLSGGISLRY